MVLSSRTQIRRSFSNAAQTYELAACHQKQVAEQLMGCYQQFHHDEDNKNIVADIGSGTGFVGNYCFQTNLFDAMLSLDISEAMLQQDNHFKNSKIKVCADLQNLPFKNQSIDLCLSSYAFQWANNIDQLFAEVFRVLKPGGLLFFSIPGPSTFYELKRAWSEVDDAVHVHDFLCDKKILAAAFSQGLKALHFSQKNDVLAYDNQKSALQHIKKIGATNHEQSRNKSLLGKQHYLDFSHAFRKHASPQTNYSLSYESYFFGMRKPLAKEYEYA